MTAAQHAPGMLCWFECGSRDASKSKTFYTQLFGWKSTDVPMPGGEGHYTLFKSGDHDLAGLYQLSGPQFEGVPSHWLTYVAVADVDETAERTEGLGGKIVAPPMDVPGVGRMAFLQDPTGAVIAVARFTEHPGAPVGHAPGGFGWSELATRDTDRAKVFYTEIFGWKAKPDPQHHYTEFQVGSQSVAGMMAMTPQHGDAPPHWLPYVMVENCDRVAKKAGDLGARTLVPPMDIENVGRFSVFMDPAGAALAVIQMKHS